MALNSAYEWWIAVPAYLEVRVCEIPEEDGTGIVGFTENWGAETGVNDVFIGSVTAGTEGETSVNNSAFIS